MFPVHTKNVPLSYRTTIAGRDFRGHCLVETAVTGHGPPPRIFPGLSRAGGGRLGWHLGTGRTGKFPIRLLARSGTCATFEPNHPPTPTGNRNCCYDCLARCCCDTRTTGCPVCRCSTTRHATHGQCLHRRGRCTIPTRSHPCRRARNGSPQSSLPGTFHQTYPPVIPGGNFPPSSAAATDSPRDTLLWSWNPWIAVSPPVARSTPLPRSTPNPSGADSRHRTTASFRAAPFP
jgi:hypothetical protein